jgi:hypothetical protein
LDSDWVEGGLFGKMPGFVFICFCCGIMYAAVDVNERGVIESNLMTFTLEFWLSVAVCVVWLWDWRK